MVKMIFLKVIEKRVYVKNPLAIPKHYLNGKGDGLDEKIWKYVRGSGNF
jgi:hypothetical protein